MQNHRATKQNKTPKDMYQNPPQMTNLLVLFQSLSTARKYKMIWNFANLYSNLVVSTYIQIVQWMEPLFTS